MLHTISSADNGRSVFACFVIDCTEYKKQIQKIQVSCLHDPLTGLANRVLLLDRLKTSLQLHRREASHGFSLPYIDLNDFKRINDELGHAIGDKVLLQTAQRLQPLFRAKDTICRWGGDEFIVLLGGIMDEKTGKKKAQRIHEALSLPFSIDDQEISISASIGITMSSVPFDRPKSKAAGKSQTTLQAPLVRTFSELKQLEQEMPSGYKRDEFYLVYQPVMDLKICRFPAWRL